MKHEWMEDPLFPQMEMVKTPKNRRLREAFLYAIGVPHSAVRRMIETMEGIGDKLIGASCLGHPSKTILHFDAGDYVTIIIWVDTKKGNPEETISEAKMVLHENNLADKDPGSSATKIQLTLDDGRIFNIRQLTQIVKGG